MSNTTQQKRLRPVDVIRNYTAEREVAVRQKAQFSNDGTLESWLKKIASINKLQFADSLAKLTLKHNYLVKASQMHANLKVHLAELGYLPSFSQFACAIIAHMLFTHHKKILLSIPPGKGKSRVVCALAALFASYRKTITKIFICFTSEILLETDKEIYDHLNDSSPIKIVRVVGLDSVTDSNALVILDEADHHVFDVLC